MCVHCTPTRLQLNQSTVSLDSGEIHIKTVSHLLLVKLRAVPHVLLTVYMKRRFAATVNCAGGEGDCNASDTGADGTACNGDIVHMDDHSRMLRGRPPSDAGWCVRSTCSE